MAKDNTAERDALATRFRGYSVDKMRAAMQFLENEAAAGTGQMDVPDLITETQVWDLILKRQAKLALQGVPKDATASAHFFADVWGKKVKPGSTKPQKTDHELMEDLVNKVGQLDHEPEAAGKAVASEAGAR